MRGRLRSPLREPGVDTEVREPVGVAVLLSPNVLEADGVEAACLGHDLVEEGADVRRLHPIFPRQVLDEELAVGQERDVGRAKLTSPGEPSDRGRVLGDVVRGLSEPLSDLGEHLHVGPEDGDPDARGTRIAASRAVGADPDG